MVCALQKPDLEGVVKNRADHKKGGGGDGELKAAKAQTGRVKRKNGLIGPKKGKSASTRGY